MNWQIVSAACAAAGMVMAALNAWQNVRIELRVERLRNEMLTRELGFEKRVSTLEAEIKPVRENCPLLHASSTFLPAR